MPTFPCPHCGANLRVPEDLIGCKTRCPSCMNVTIVPTPDLSPVPAAAAAPAAGPSAEAPAGGSMPDDAESFSVACPRCAIWLAVPVQYLGRDVTCARCLQVVPTPLPSEFASPPAAVPVVAPPPATPDATADEADIPAPRRKSDVRRAAQGKDAEPALSPPLAARAGKRKKKKKKRRSFRLPAIAIDSGVFKPVLILGSCILVIGGLIFAFRTLFEKGGAPASIALGNWQPYEVKDRFSALLPTPFRMTQPELTILGGDALIKIRASWPEQESASNAIYTQSYSAGYTPNALPAAYRSVPVDDLLNRICNDIVARGTSAGDVEVNRRSIKLGSYPGMEVTVSVRHGKHITRVYLAHHRIYLIAAGGRGIEPNQPNVKLLFESLKILDTGKD